MLAGIRTHLTYASALFAAIVIVGGLIASSASAGAKEYGYVTTTLELPTNDSAAYAYARDVDGDGDRDNALGQFFAELAADNVDLQSDLDGAIARGDLLMLHSLRTPSLSNTREASWQVLYAEPTEAPDFSGAGVFTVAAPGWAPRSSRLATKIKNHDVKTAAGTIPLQLDSGSGIFTLNLTKGKVFAKCFRPNCSDGRINGAITADELDTNLVPELAQAFTARVQEDCPMPGSPDGGCMADSEGKTLRNLFDANKNHVIAAEEMRQSSLGQDALAPDLDLVKANGQPGQDGVNDALSFGLGFEAARAQLVR